jgi:hypothetical protein
MTDPNLPDDSPPFQRHKYYYIALKFVVLAIGIGLAIYVFGLMREP